MMQYQKGIFGVLDTDGMEDPKVYLMDGGVEQRCRENYYFCNSMRPGYGGYLFLFTLEGCGKFRKNGTEYDLPAGTGFFVRFPEESAYFLPEEEDGSWTFLYLHFGGTALEPLAARIEELTGGVFSLGMSAKSAAMGLQLQERILGGERLLRYEGGELVYSFMCTLLREIEDPEDTQKNSVSQRAVEIMEREYAVLDGIQEVAERLGISTEHFCRIFRQEVHRKPIQYLTDLRIQAAMCDLLNTEDTLEVIARRSGFSNANYFGKVFKKQVGVTPMAYRTGRQRL